MFDTAKPASVFGQHRNIVAPAIALPPHIIPNRRLQMDGLALLAALPEAAIPAVFFDPQYRGILDKLAYGNEGQRRGRQRSQLTQMPEATISSFLAQIDRALMPSGHLFLWLDKFHLCQGFRAWAASTQLEVVDLIVWHKDKLGMGYRSRRVSEYCAVLQKRPKRAKGVWKIHNIPDVWQESVKRRGGVHPKPVRLQSALIAAVTNCDDIVIDPAAGSFTVLEACREQGRNFLGCDINLTLLA